MTSSPEGEGGRGGVQHTLFYREISYVASYAHDEGEGGSQKVTNDDEGEGGGHDTPQK